MQTLLTFICGNDAQMNNLDQFDLERFVKAQDRCYQQVLAELDEGRKSTHWIWFIFPQVTGFGSSRTSEIFSIKSRDEAEAYLLHSILGQRLIQCVGKVVEHADLGVRKIFGFPDFLKFHSSLTLFFIISREKKIYKQAIDIFYQGKLDEKTVEKLNKM